MKFSKLQDRSFDNEVSSPSPFRYEGMRLLWMSCLLMLWLAGHQAQAISSRNASLENPPSAGKAGKPRYSKDLLLLTQWFVGDFDNTKQCRVDTGAQPVESHVVKIWDNYFTDAVWIYEEFQSPPGQVTSQRIYKFMDYTAGRFESKVYTLENFSELAGEYKNLRPFEQFTPENLEDHPYCVVYWTRKGETRFTGSTVGTDCHLLRGRHKYVTNQIDVYPTRVSRTHKVFGWENEQVSGPKADEKGSELRRIVPPKPKKVKPVKKPTAKKGVKSSSAKKASAKKGSNAKGKSKKSKTPETTPEENPEILNSAGEETGDAPAPPKKSFWDRFKRQ
ncbi:MAG: chromophore lyase CpcT/CpeT [Bacteroidetes bacterium]|nr:chromophore lyase CpcT/CpeT [Bacteroidota bacterium]